MKATILVFPDGQRHQDTAVLGQMVCAPTKGQAIWETSTLLAYIMVLQKEFFNTETGHKICQ